MKYIKLRINKDGFVGEKGEKLSSGKEIKLEAFDDLTPRSSFYQRRIKDATIDNCVSIIKEEKKTISLTIINKEKSK